MRFVSKVEIVRNIRNDGLRVYLLSIILKVRPTEGDRTFA